MKNAMRNLVALVVLVGLLFGFYHVALSRALEAQRDKIRRHGYPATWDELLAATPVPPDNEDTVALLDRAKNEYVFLIDFDYTLEEDGGVVLPAADAALATNILVLLREHVSSNLACLALLHQAARVQTVRLEYHGTHSGFPGDFLRDGVKVLWHEAVLQLENADTERAVAAVTAGLRASRLLARQHYPFAFQQGCWSYDQWVPVLARLLSRAALSESQLRSLQNEFLSSEDRDGVFRSVAAYLCEDNELFLGAGPLRIYHGTMRRPGDSWHGKALALNKLLVLARLKRVGPLLDVRKLPEAEWTEAAAAWLRQKKPLFAPYWNQEPLYAAPLQSALRSLAQLRLAQAALAIELERLRTGQLPQTPAQLPTDPFTGRPLIYQRLDQGYRLHSVGTNAVDDAADPGLDLVFRVHR